MNKLFPFLCLIYCISFDTLAQGVYNIVASQYGKNIIVSYDLNGNEKQYDLSLFVSEDGGNKWHGPLKAVSGDIGEKQTAGKNKSIKWDVLKEEGRTKLSSMNVQFKIEVKFEGSTLMPPQIYSSFNIAVDNKKSDKRRKYGEPIWLVYSDRDSNLTYYDSACNLPYKRINFNQTFIVADETDDAIRIVEWKNDTIPVFEEEKKTLFKKSALGYGWIQKDKMLIWYHAIMNENHNFIKKAVFFNADKSLQLENSKIIKVFRTPNLKNEFIYKTEDIEFPFLFVLKEDTLKNAVLLAFTPRINNVNPILGWASKSSCFIWDNPNCIKINNTDAAIIERREKSSEIKVYRSFEEADEAKNTEAGIKIPQINNDSFSSIFPIIQNSDTKNKDILKIAYSQNKIKKDGKFEKYSSFSPMFVNLKSKNLENPIFENCLFLHKKEIEYMLDFIYSLEEYVFIGGSTINRDTLYKRLNFCNSLYLQNIGLENITFSDIYCSNLGIYSDLNYQKNFKIKDVLNPKKVTDDDLLRLKVSIWNVERNIKEVKKNKTYCIDYEDEMFYIIPTSKFKLNL